MATDNIKKEHKKEANLRSPHSSIWLLLLFILFMEYLSLFIIDSFSLAKATIMASKIFINHSKDADKDHYALLPTALFQKMIFHVPGQSMARGLLMK